MFIHLTRELFTFKNYQINSSQQSSLLILILITAFLTTIISGCEESTGPQRQTGNISGFIQPVDQWLRPMNDKSGITVSLKGTSDSTVTDTEGRYELQDVETGIYTIEFDKQDYGTNKIPFFDFVGGGNVFVQDSNPVHGNTPIIGQTPTYTSEIDSMYPPQSGQVPLKVLFSEAVPDSGVAMHVVFQGDSSNVSSDPSNHNFFAFFYVPPGYEGFIGHVIPNRGKYVRFYPAAGFIVFPDPKAKSSNMAWASLGSPTEVKNVSDNTQSGQGMSKTSNFRGEIVFLGNDGEVIERMSIPENANWEDVTQIRKRVRNKISDFRKQWFQ